MTRGDEIVSAIEVALADLRHVSHGSYQRQDISRIIDPLGSRLECFLRIAAWPGSSRRENFYDLIERARSAGLVMGSRAAPMRSPGPVEIPSARCQLASPPGENSALEEWRRSNPIKSDRQAGEGSPDSTRGQPGDSGNVRSLARRSSAGHLGGPPDGFGKRAKLPARDGRPRSRHA